MKNRLFEQIDNSPLIIFRMFLGILLACETWGAIGTGWVKANLIDPKFTFAHIHMEWLQPLPGYGMYIYFIIMGICGLAVMAGFKYRWSLGLFTIMWAAVYFMQKTTYNNHYYLLMLVCFIMCFLPANRYAAIDSLKNPSIRRLTMPAWCSWVMIAQVTIVYVYASLAKFYPGWLDGTFTRSLMERSITPSLLPFFTQKWVYLGIAYMGILFDLLIVPLLLWKRTRTIALIASVIFHLFNSITLQIGIFPFFALSFVVFFYPPEKMRRIFFKNKPQVTDHSPTYEGKNIFWYFFVPYLIIQLLLPARHLLMKGDVLWTEEGHRLSWRMMLRFRNGMITFKVVDKKDGSILPYNVTEELTPKQKSGMAAKPDMIWQMCQRIKKQYAAQGKDVAVYVDAMASINNGPMRLLINPNTDLAAAEWNYWGHDEWVLIYADNSTTFK